MTRQLVFETVYNGNAGTVSARPMIREHDDMMNEKWSYKPHRMAWDYSLDTTDNHALAVRYSCRGALQKDPVSIEWGGESVKGKFWIVTVTQ